MNCIALICMYIDLVKQLQSVKIEKVMLTLSKQIKFIEVSMNFGLHYIFY